VWSAACGKAESAQAKGREAPAKAVAADDVRQEDVRRSVDVVGTLAAEDQVTIASQAEGAVSRVLVDLGDHVKTGQPLIELDREKLEYNLQNQKAALARALAKYGANEPRHLPPTGDTGREEGRRGAATSQTGLRPREKSSTNASSFPSKRSTMPMRRFARSRRPTNRRFKMRRT
jgi:multidrug efflux pump subunit AcrA (membrane-fusion protein)